MNLAQFLRSGERSAWPELSLDEYINQVMTYQGSQYNLFGQSSLGFSQDEIPQTFTGIARSAYKSNGPIFALMLLRMMLFSEARLLYQDMHDGRPGKLSWGDGLSVIENPYPGGSTGDLLGRAIQDQDMAGNWFCAREGNRLRRLRPDWVTIVMGSHSAPETPGYAHDAEAIGYVYHPPSVEPEVFLANRVAHWAQVPDPEANFRGMSWVTPIIREAMADGAATTHKLKFFENGATPNMVVSLDPGLTVQKYNEWKEAFDDSHKGVLNAYKTLYLGGGADVEVVGANMRQIDFKATQGAGETRLASAAGVPAIVAGFSEGLASGTYSNYGQAVRRLSDMTMRPLWRGFVTSLAPIIQQKPGSRLWYDSRDIAFLKQDEQDAALIMQTRGSVIRNLIDAGYKPETVVAAVESEDFTLLEHTGLFSVQLQPPGTVAKPAAQLPPAPDDGTRARALRSVRLLDAAPDERRRQLEAFLLEP